MTTIDQTRAVLQRPEAPALVDDRARAERVAAARRRREMVQNLIIRLVSLAMALGAWQIVGMNTDPVLFTTPYKVFWAAIDMIWTGELWQALWPSLIVLIIGLSLAIVFGIAVGLLLARFHFLDVAMTVYITFLYSI